MNMYIHELKVYRKSTIVWTLSLIAIVILFMSIFPAFAKDVAVFQKYVDSLPKTLIAALGIASLDLSVLGFYSVIFIYIMLCSSIQAMNIGLSIVSNEERGKTADFLLSKPITRQQIITSKLLAALTYFDPQKIIKNSAYEIQFVIITIAFVIIATVGSYVLYSKKDMANV